MGRMGGGPSMGEADRRPDQAAPRAVPMRLQRFLARSGVASRRGSENLMTAGRVQVNGLTVTELGSKVDPLADVVTVDGRPVVWDARPFHLMLNKPAGVLSTMKDPKGRPTVADLVPVGEHPGLFCVGRLDRDTTGLLLFTTDGDLAQALLHPSREKAKRYIALVEGTVRAEALRALEEGIVLDDGPTAPARARIVAAGDPEAAAVLEGSGRPGGSIVELEIHEGRKHQVKRMLAAVGHPVARLHRVSFGPLELGDLPLGTWRELTGGERALLEEISPRGYH